MQCASCGASSDGGETCRYCGAAQGATTPPHGGAAPSVATPPYAGLSGDKNKIVAALLAFFLGMLGIHKFYLGKTNAGIIMLLSGTIGWFFFAIPPLVIGIIAFIEFIIYLVKSDQQFHQDYVLGGKSWF